MLTTVKHDISSGKAVIRIILQGKGFTQGILEIEAPSDGFQYERNTETGTQQQRNSSWHTSHVFSF